MSFRFICKSFAILRNVPMSFGRNRSFERFLDANACENNDRKLSWS